MEGWMQLLVVYVYPVIDCKVHNLMYVIGVIVMFR